MVNLMAKSGIGEWTTFIYTSQLMINTNTPYVDKNYRLESLNIELCCNNSSS